MQLKPIFLLMIFLQPVLSGHSQITKSTNEVSQAWFAYFNQTRFNKRWGLWGDVQLRTKEELVNNLSESVIRVGLTYYLSNDTRLTFGYAFVNHFPGDNHADISQPEHRIWQQIQWHYKYSRMRLAHRMRLEEKFRHKIANDDNLSDGYNYNWKIRYNLLLNVPLNKKAFAPNTFSFVLNDEIHVNFGKEIVYNYFDQNRFFAGLSYHTSPGDNLQFGYMNLFQQLAAGNSYRVIHAARISYFHNLDIWKR